MIFNVAQLLKAPVGTVQAVELDNEDALDLLDEEIQLTGPITGEMRLHRTNQGIFVSGTVHAPLWLQCSRCLKEFSTELAFPLREEFYPTIDVETGLPLPAPESELAFPITPHHELDLREAIRQNLVLALPIRALCHEECAGLCPQCGKDLNTGSCACQPDVEDERFSVLRGLLNGSEAAETS
ncbi:MAG: DUF177 domain-containing protein [Ktedonobacterales bacterium]|nr:DUF177 domain-containing protein [Ktedonobacterales bacterium]